MKCAEVPVGDPAFTLHELAAVEGTRKLAKIFSIPPRYNCQRKMLTRPTYSGVFVWW
jgi:hypothetical protein